MQRRGERNEFICITNYVKNKSRNQEIYWGRATSNTSAYAKFKLKKKASRYLGNLKCQKMKFSVKKVFSKGELICRKLYILGGNFLVRKVFCKYHWISPWWITRNESFYIKKITPFMKLRWSYHIQICTEYIYRAIGWNVSWVSPFIFITKNKKERGFKLHPKLYPLRNRIK